MSIQNLGFVCVFATDLEAWRKYGEGVLGLMESPDMPAKDGFLYLKMDDRPYRFMIVKRDEDRFGFSAWELESEAELAALEARLADAGVEVEVGSEDCTATRAVSRFIRFLDPDGNQNEAYIGQKDGTAFQSPVGVKSFVTGEMGLGHAVLPAPKLTETHAFYKDVVGFGDSDFMQVKMSPDPDDPGVGLNFMHAASPRHHALALFGMPMPSGCVHLMLEVPDMDEVGKCMDRVEAAEVPIVASLGRHTNDGMLSVYIGCPGGFAIEYGCEGMQMDWDAHVPTVTENGDIWGHKYNIL